MSTPVGGADLYAILGVERHADEAAINASYRRLAKLKHPDKNRANPQATAEFQDLNKAYSVLRDARLRRDYDQRHPAPRLRPRGPPATPPAEPAGVHPQSAARAAAATAAENAKTSAQRRAEADAALQANATRYGSGSSRNKTSRKNPFRFMRMPATWHDVPDDDGDNHLFAADEDPACKALQAEINALRRAMQQRDAADAALRRQQKQLAAHTDAAWAAVGQHAAALRALDAQLAARQASQDWFEGLFGTSGTAGAPGTSGPASEAAAAAAAVLAEKKRLRAILDRAQRALDGCRAKAHAVVAQLAASAALGETQDAQFKALAARYRAAAFKSGGAGDGGGDGVDAAAAPPPHDDDDDAYFDGWVAWEAPPAAEARNLWQDDDDDDGEGGGGGGGGGAGLWDSDGEGKGGSDAHEDGHRHGESEEAGPKQQGFPFNAAAAEYVPQQQQAAAVDGADAPAGQSDGGTNVWDDVSSEERFNADLLHMESDEDGPAGVKQDETEVGEEVSEEGDDGEDAEADEEGNEEGNEEADNVEGKDEDGDDEEGDEEDEAEEDNYDDDTAAAWRLDEDLCEAYTEQLDLDADSWHPEVCREW